MIVAARALWAAGITGSLGALWAFDIARALGADMISGIKWWLRARSA